jgi:hypothetical protein
MTKGEAENNIAYAGGHVTATTSSQLHAGGQRTLSGMGRAKSGLELVDDFVHRVRAKRHCTHMKLLHFHLCRVTVEKERTISGRRITILGQGTSLVAEKILDSAKFFR